MSEPCAACGAPGAGAKCGRCRRASYCGAACQRSHWKAHKGQCALVAAAVLAGTSSAETPVAAHLSVATRGAAGWAAFRVGGQDFLAVANFFSSGPGRRPSMATDSVVYRADVVGGRLALTKHQQFRTTGAHGVAHVAGFGAHLLVFPNYYGGDALVVKWKGEAHGLVEEHQRLIVDGGGNVVAFEVDGRPMISIAEFNKGRANIYELREDTKKFALVQHVAAGVRRREDETGVNTDETSIP